MLKRLTVSSGPVPLPRWWTDEGEGGGGDADGTGGGEDAGATTAETPAEVASTPGAADGAGTADEPEGGSEAEVEVQSLLEASSGGVTRARAPISCASGRRDPHPRFLSTPPPLSVDTHDGALEIRPPDGMLSIRDNCWVAARRALAEAASAEAAEAAAASAEAAAAEAAAAEAAAAAAATSRAQAEAATAKAKERAAAPKGTGSGAGPVARGRAAKGLKKGGNVALAVTKARAGGKAGVKKSRVVPSK